MWLAAWKLVSNDAKRKAHSRTAKCEAFHVAPRLFFMFLFLIPFTIRQHCIIYPQEFSTEAPQRQHHNVGTSLRHVSNATRDRSVENSWVLCIVAESSMESKIKT